MKTCLSAVLILAVALPAAAQTCTPAQLADILAPADEQHKNVEVACSATLPYGSIVSKRLYFTGSRASNTVFDCNGSTISPSASGGDAILIRSQNSGGRWLRPENISISNCRVDGSVRIQGMGSNGEAAALRASSHQAGHTQRARDAAPTNIRLNKMTILGRGRVPLYLAPGVTYTSVAASKIGGISQSVAVYLDAESDFNTFMRNTIDSKTGRELIAIDGSSGNVFAENRFSSLNKGGIYFYRNCGEGGTVRHQTPSENTLRDNTFFYRRYRGYLPAVWLGARQGNRKYCAADAGFGFGSSADDRDFADNNVISGNRIYRLSPAKMIRNRGGRNLIDHNRTVFE